MSPAEWIQSNNFAGLSPRTLSKMNSMSHITNGVRIDDACQMFFSWKGMNTTSLKRQGAVGYLIATASDTMGIKPCLQFSRQVNGIIGLLDPPVMMSEEVKELLGKSDTEITTYLKTC